ncbi:MAG: sugar ABC transporter permease [Lachnospiraceae bacterium]|nr:sugar ABC transporter permease [Lachnospiraceae bacterium]
MGDKNKEKTVNEPIAEAVQPDGRTKKKHGYNQMSYTKKKELWGFIFLLPWIFGVIFFFLVPVVKTFYYSFFEMTLKFGGFDYVYKGIENFKYALTVDPNFNTYLLQALKDFASNVPIQIFVSLFIAMMLNGKYKGRGFFRVIFFIPIILATGITDVELKTMNIAAQESQKFVSADFLIDILMNSGIPQEALNFILEAVANIFEVITKAGVQILIFLAGLQGINPSLYEVAKLEGCSKFECFCKITLPMISPMILVCMVYSIADTFAAAEISTVINTTTFTNAKYGLGAAMSGIYFVVSVGVTLLCTFIVSKVVFYYDN